MSGNVAANEWHATVTEGKSPRWPKDWAGGAIPFLWLAGAAMSLITLNNLKTFLGITTASEDATLGPVVAAVDAAVKKYLGRTLERAARVDYFCGNGRPRLYLRESPLAELGYVRVDQGGYYGQGVGSPFGTETQLTLGSDFVYESVLQDETNRGCLIHLGAGWPCGVGNIKVSYTAGYTTIPSDVVLACYSLATVLRAGREDGGVPMQSENLGDYSYQLLSGGAAGVKGTPYEVTSAISMLKAYRKVVV